MTGPLGHMLVHPATGAYTDPWQSERPFLDECARDTSMLGVLASSELRER